MEEHEVRSLLLLHAGSVTVLAGDGFFSTLGLLGAEAVLGTVFLKAGKSHPKSPEYGIWGVGMFSHYAPFQSHIHLPLHTPEPLD